MNPVLIAVSVIIFAIAITAFIIHYVNRSTKIDMNGNRRNFKVRYEPSKHKYYLTNASPYGDIDVCRYGLFRVYYKSKIDADLVMQKLNDYQ